MNFRFWDRQKPVAAAASINIDDIVTGRVQVRGKDGNLVQIRQQREYAAARNTRLNTDWRPTGSDANTEVRGSLEPMRNRSRQQSRDNPYAKGAIRTITNSVIGRGIAPVVQLKGADGEIDEVLSQNVEDVYWLWHKAKNCHAGRSLTVSQIQRVAFRSTLESGESFVRRIKGYDRGLKIPLFIDVIEADHCPIWYDGQRPLGDGRFNKIQSGIEYNGFGEPVAYYLYDRHPGSTEGPGELRRILASEIIHLYDPFRPGQRRGVPEGHTVMDKLNGTNAYEDAEITAARMAAAKAVWFKNTSNGVTLGEDSKGDQYMDWEPGSVGVLPHGWDVASVDPQHPNSNLVPFVSHLLRGGATGWGLSFESFTNDRSQANYSSGRAGTLAERITFAVWMDLFNETFNARLWEWFLVAAYTGEVIDIPGFFDGALARERILDSVRWQGPAWPMVDPQKETTAKVDRLTNGLTSLTSELADEGQDFREVVLQQAKDKKFLESKGLKFEWMVDKTTMLQAAGVSTPPHEELPADTTLQPTPAAVTPATTSEAVTGPTIALNGAQVASAVDVVTKVVQGQIPRDAGLAILRISFALTEEDAASMMGTAGNGFKPKVMEEAA